MSNANFNPYNPHDLGAEWFATVEASPDVYGLSSRGQGSTDVASSLKNLVSVPGQTAVGVRLDSRYTETIKFLYPYIESTDSGTWLFEVWDIDDVPDAVLTFHRYLPAVDAGRCKDVYVWNTVSVPGLVPASATDVYRGINNLALSPGVWPNNGHTFDDSSLIYPIFGSGYEANFRFGTVAGTLTGKQISMVSVWANVKEFIDFYQVSPMAVQPYVEIASKRYFAAAVSIEGDTRREVRGNWLVNPATGAPWTVEDVERFDSATGSNGYSCGWVVKPTGSSNNLATILQGQLHVTTAGTDPRVAFGVLSTASSSRKAGWVQTRVRTPSGGDWLKLEGSRYLITFRKTSGRGQLLWRYLEQPGVAPAQPPVMYGAALSLTAGASRPVLPLSNTNRTRGYALLLRKSAGSAGQSLDSQPYASINDDRGVSGEVEGTLAALPRPGEGFWTRVHAAYDFTGQEDAFIEQEFTPALTDQYGFLRMLVRLVPKFDGTLIREQVARLVVRIFDRATDTQQGRTIFVYPDDLNPDRRLFQTVAKRIPGTAPVLIAGERYYVKFSTAAKPTDVGSWGVQVLSGVPQDPDNPPPPGTGDATAGGAENAYTLVSPSGGFESRQETLDACVVVHTVPDPPTGFQASTTAEPPGLAACSSGELDDAGQHVEVVWDSTSISVNEGGGFSHYEIQRDDNDGFGWQTIARITDETCNSFDDYEHRFGCQVRYRMRVVRVDGAPSDWTDGAGMGAVTPVMTSPGYTYTSNFAPGYGVWYDDENPRRYEFVENFTDHEFYQRDGGVTFRELEDRLDRIPVEVIVRLGEQRVLSCSGQAGSGSGEADPACPTIDVGRRVFDPLLVLGGNKKDRVLGTKLALPYVCVRDRNGNRWFSSLETPSGEIELGKHYSMSVLVKERTQVPSAVDKTCGPAAGSASGSGATTPCSFIFDSFPNGSASGSGEGGCYALATSTSGHPWLFVGVPGDWCKLGGVASPLSGGPMGGGSLAVFKHNTRNHYAAADYIENGSTGWSLVVRADSVAAAMIALNVTAGAVSVYDVTAGVPALLGSGPGGGVDGANYRLEVEDGFVTVKEDAVTIAGPFPTTVTVGLHTGQFDYDALTATPVAAPTPEFDNFATGCL